MEESLLEKLAKNTKIRIATATIAAIMAYEVATSYTPVTQTTKAYAQEPAQATTQDQKRMKEFYLNLAKLGEQYNKTGKYSETVSLLKEPMDNISMNESGNLKEDITCCLVKLIYAYQYGIKDYENAERYTKLGLEFNPEFGPFWLGLAIIYYRTEKNPREALDFVNKYEQLGGKEKALVEGLRRKLNERL